MSTRVVVFDVNETLSDMSPLGGRFVAAGAPEGTAALWFAGVLRDGIGRSAAGSPAPFAEVAEGGLRALLGGMGLSRPLDEAVEDVMQAMRGLGVHPDVVPGLRALSAAGWRVATLSNGAAEVAEGLLERVGARDLVERVLSVEDAGAWKPARAAYAHASSALGAPAGDMVMAAVHPWDIDGAARAGLATAWIDRRGAPYPSHLAAPDLTATGVVDLARRLGTPA
jgi:2-haloacid dehalogenase